MKKDELVVLFTNIAILFPKNERTYLDATKETYQQWYRLLGDIPFDLAKAAVEAHACTSPFPPTIADIRQRVAKIRQGETGELTEAEAWAMVSKAISRASSYSVRDFEAFPPAVKRAVGSPRQLCEWGLMEVEVVQSVVSSNFRRSYAQALTQHREATALPENIRAQIEGLASRLALEEGGKK